MTKQASTTNKELYELICSPTGTTRWFEFDSARERMAFLRKAMIYSLRREGKLEAESYAAIGYKKMSVAILLKVVVKKSGSEPRKYTKKTSRRAA